MHGPEELVQTTFLHDLGIEHLRAPHPQRRLDEKLMAGRRRDRAEDKEHQKSDIFRSDGSLQVLHFTRHRIEVLRKLPVNWITEEHIGRAHVQCLAPARY